MAEDVGRPGWQRFRTVLAVVLLTLAVTLAPVAAVGTWARAQLVDTERFVATFAPLAHDPEVQEFIVTQVTDAIDTNLDLDQVINDLVEGLIPLNLSPRALAAIRILSGPAAQQVREMIHEATESLVSSTRFAALWEVSLRRAHLVSTSALNDEPGALLRISDEGMLTLELGPVVALVKQGLQDRGFELARLIPEVTRSVPLVRVEHLNVVKTVYQVAVVAGYWSPWVVIGLLAAGVLAARQRLRALGWACVGLTGAFLLLGTAFGIGRRLFISGLSPSIMPAGTAAVVWDRATVLMGPLITTLTLLAGVAALALWLVGPSSTAVALRARARQWSRAERSSAA
ncbi:hypothetical protein ACPCG0_00840 [Propionibacteriaceae bacterium Y1923]|uniref:hypothetical protein n=1 Tax=Aestuariimicrobium sp. Y1814 TaxID=3418742 RepID=UPI003C28CD66